MAVGDINCKKCLGAGFVTENGRFIKCDECLTVSIDNANREDKVSESEVIDRLKQINAPDFVLEKDFEYKGDKILRDRSIPKEERQSVEMESYVNGLTDLNEISASGVKLPYSYLVLAGRGYSKTMAKWSVIKNYLRKGYTASNVLSTEDVINLKVMGNTKSIEEYNNYFDNDLVVLDLMGSISNPKLNITCMVEVLEKCGRMNKPLICFGSFSRENILERSWGLERILKNSKLIKGKYGEFKVIEYEKPKTDDIVEFSFKNNR